MGDPKKIKSKFSGPSHPWQSERIEEERTLQREYGLKNKTELYRAQSRLKTFSDLAKKLIAARGPQAEKEREQLLTRLARLGLIKPGAQLDDILGLQLKNILDRRLQTLVARKGLARSIKQSRQFIAHEHVIIGNKVVSAPGYHVLLDEENVITFIQNSPFASASHPERALPPKKPEKEVKEKPKEGPRQRRKIVRPKRR